MSKNLSERFITEVWKFLHILTMDTFTSKSMLISSRNLLATICSASSGHGWNQSIVQQLIREGNFLRGGGGGLEGRRRRVSGEEEG